MTAPIDLSVTTLDEIVLAISELGFRRERGELSWPELEPEYKALKAMLRQRTALFHGHADDDVYTLAALLILDGMVAQHQCDLRLAARARPPFGNRG
jgi:hypothetical protein